MLNVLIDTNAMIYAFDGKKDLREIFERNSRDSFRFFCLDACINELAGLGRNDVAGWAAASGIETVKTREGGSTDDKMLDEAAKSGFVLLTEDRELIEMAKKTGIKTVRVAGNGLVFG